MGLFKSKKQKLAEQRAIDEQEAVFNSTPVFILLKNAILKLFSDGSKFLEWLKSNANKGSLKWGYGGFIEFYIFGNGKGFSFEFHTYDEEGNAKSDGREDVRFKNIELCENMELKSEIERKAFKQFVLHQINESCTEVEASDEGIIRLKSNATFHNAKNEKTHNTEYRYYQCECGAKYRVPAHKGHIIVNCPRCRKEKEIYDY